MSSRSVHTQATHQAIVVANLHKTQSCQSYHTALKLRALWLEHGGNDSAI